MTSCVNISPLQLSMETQRNQKWEIWNENPLFKYMYSIYISNPKPYSAYSQTITLENEETTALVAAL